VGFQSTRFYGYFLVFNSVQKSLHLPHQSLNWVKS